MRVRMIVAVAVMLGGTLGFAQGQGRIEKSTVESSGRAGYSAAMATAGRSTSGSATKGRGWTPCAMTRTGIRAAHQNRQVSDRRDVEHGHGEDA